MKAVLTFFATDAELERVRAKLPKDARVFAPKSRPNLSRLECSLRDLGDELADADAVMGWVMPAGGFGRAKPKGVPKGFKGLIFSFSKGVIGTGSVTRSIF